MRTELEHDWNWQPPRRGILLRLPAVKTSQPANDDRPADKGQGHMTDRKPWDHGGKTRQQRGYGREHNRLRARLLAQEPLCRLCKAKNPPRVTAATIADHIQSIASGGAVHDINNLQPVCLRCHQVKSLTEQGKRPRKTFGEDGWPTDD